MFFKILSQKIHLSSGGKNDVQKRRWGMGIFQGNINPD